MKKYLLIATAVIAALVGCKKQTQSEVDFADVKQNATISGQVVFMADEAGKATEEMKMEGVRVYFQVANSEYMTGTDGNKQFSAVTDAEGNFSITVPTGAAGVTGDLLTDMFQGEQAGKTIWFAANEDYKAISLNAGDTRVRKIKLQKDLVLSECIGEGVVKGVATYDAGFVEKSDGTREALTNATKEGMVVVARVTYKYNGVDEFRNFVKTTGADGKYEFSIPTQDNGNVVDLSIDQFAAQYTTFKNNQWVKQDWFFKMGWMSACDASDPLMANTTRIKDIQADKESQVVTPSKTQVKFNVTGKFMQQAEVGEYNAADELIGYKHGNVASAYTFTVRLDLYDGGDVVSSIVYEGNKINDDKKGTFSVPVQLYDEWNINNVKVSVYADKTEKVEDFKHKYYTAEDPKAGKWPSKVEDMSTQLLTGTYKGGAGSGITKPVTDSQLFFDLEVGEIELKFNPEKPDDIRGVGHDCDWDDSHNRQYDGGLNWPY